MRVQLWLLRRTFLPPSSILGHCADPSLQTIVNGKQVCVPNAGCSLPNTLVQLLTGRAECVCARGYISDLTGGVS